MFSRIFAIVISVLFSLPAVSQDGSVRVKVFSGSNLDFIFNSINDYKSGVIYTDYTILGIEATEGVPTNRTNWEITIQAEDAVPGVPDNAFNGTNITNTIPFSVLEVQASSIISCSVPMLACPVNTFGAPGPWLPLSNVPQLLIDSRALGAGDNIPPDLFFTTTQVYISFRCGFGGTLLGATADYYTDELWIDINFAL